MSHRDQYVKPLDGGGADYSDGRFHLKNMGKVTYIAKDIRTALLESRKILLDSNDNAFRGSHSPPFVIYSVQFNMRKVLDLTDQNLLDELELDISDITGNWWLSDETTSTQFIGSTAYNSDRFHAVAYRSARNSLSVTNYDDEYDTNFAVFPTKLDNRSFLEAIPPTNMEDDACFLVGQK
ncbi:RES family NAD+ phosphorylase [Deinococcus marmoris]|uniref:RES family NAD+ phosphorylase n=1 Tax=Deinococcus marmoris TaxID=249408 RepID=UPI00096AC553|nr:RES family NAD+ phosphorylase [Deinococcus marmoris]